MTAALGAKALRVALIVAVLGVLPAPVATADVAEPCPNQPYRQASDSTKLPGCRAYELVSPPETGGPVDEATLNLWGVPGQEAWQGSTSGPRLSLHGNLASQLDSALDVKASGSAVFWDSQTTPPGSGAIEDGHGYDPFRSLRTPTGWSTEDLFPSGQIRQQVPGGLSKVVFGASEDGSSALIASQVVLDPDAFANPQQAALGEWKGVSIYRVTANGSRPPQFVTRGEFLLPENLSLLAGPFGGAGPFEVASASSDLNSVAFKSDIPLEAHDACNAQQGAEGNNIESEGSMYLWNASSSTSFSHLAFSFPNHVHYSCSDPNISEVVTILPDARPILIGNPANMESTGPFVENAAEPSSSDPNVPSLLPLAGFSGGELRSITPDGSTAYIHFEGNIYAVSTTTGWEGAGTPCVSCTSDQTDVSYIGTSEDGSHVLFTTDQGLWEWALASGAQLLTSAKNIGPEDVVVSENGEYVVLLTSEALSPCELINGPPCEDTDNGSDLYELSVAHPPRLLTSGSSDDLYSLYSRAEEQHPGEGGNIVSAGVSNRGQRIVYNRIPTSSASLEVVDEWDAGQTVQLSPLGSQSNYDIQAVAGSELRDVFFIAHDAIVPWDLNDGQADIYDARVEGGFPFCTAGDPEPSPGAYGCGAETSDANPIAPPTMPYPENLAPSSFQLASLPADTSRPVGTYKAKALSRSRKLLNALKACRKRPERRRAACERQARKQYARAKAKGKKR